MSGINDILYIITIAFSAIWSGLLIYCVLRMAAWKRPETDRFYKPFVSVVIAGWNEKKIGDAIRSVLSQDYPRKKMEIVVVGGGDDRMVEVCRQMQRRKTIRFIEEKTREGKWNALNKGVRAAKGDVIAFTDADCVARQGWLSGLVSSLSKKDVMGVLGNVEPIGNNFVSRAYMLLMPMYNMFSFFIGVPFFCGWCSAFKREVFKKVAFREGAVEDFVFITDVIRNKMKVTLCEKAIVGHRFPLTVGGLINAHLRVVIGTYRSMLWHPLVMFGFLTSIFGAVSNANVLYGYIGPGQNPVLNFMPLFAIVPVSAAFYYMKRFGRMRYIRNVLDVVAVMVILGAINMVALVLFLVGQKVEWKIYKK